MPAHGASKDTEPSIGLASVRYLLLLIESHKIIGCLAVCECEWLGNRVTHKDKVSGSQRVTMEIIMPSRRKLARPITIITKRKGILETGGTLERATILNYHSGKVNQPTSQPTTTTTTTTMTRYNKTNIIATL